MLDGKVYGLPALSDRQYWASPGTTPRSPRRSASSRRGATTSCATALKAIADHGTYAPMTLALGANGRMRDQVDDLAQAAGFPGYQGLRYDTGEYEYHDDTYVNAIELLKEINDNGWLLPGTNSFQVPDARGRWAAGNVGFFLDGPWSPGGVRALNAEHLPRMAHVLRCSPPTARSSSPPAAPPPPRGSSPATAPTRRRRAG